MKKLSIICILYILYEISEVIVFFYLLHSSWKIGRILAVLIGVKLFTILLILIVLIMYLLSIYIKEHKDMNNQ